MLYLTVDREGGAGHGALAVDGRAGDAYVLLQTLNDQTSFLAVTGRRSMTAHHGARFYSYVRRHANKWAALPHVCPHDSKEACLFLRPAPCAAQLHSARCARSCRAGDEGEKAGERTRGRGE